MKNIDIGSLIRNVLHEKHINVSELAKKINLTQPTVSLMIKKGTLSANKLIKVSQALDYNFFYEIGGLLNIKEPANKLLEEEKANTKNQIAQLKADLKKANDENVLMKKMIDAFADKK